MFGRNPIRKPVNDDGAKLEVKSIFPTLQGEGPYTGWPSVFVRLGGCNLACSFCDTEFEEYESKTINQIIGEVKQLSLDESGARTRRLVVITGGEPLRQNIAPLCELLIADGFKVQIETNGTLFRPLPDAVEIVCSPKVQGEKYYKLRDDLLSRTQALKFIISSSHAAYGNVPDIGQGQYKTPVYVQPMDEYNEAKNADNLSLALRLASTHGYLLSLQTHKLLGID